ILERHKGEIAVVLVDPLPPRAGLIPLRRDYAELLRRFTREDGSVLMFDEVISFRLGYHGAQGEIGVMPDLTALAKIIGGVIRVGALASNAEIMEVFDPTRGRPRVRNGGTFNANPVTMVAGRTSMELLTPEAFKRINELGQAARTRIDAA